MSRNTLVGTHSLDPAVLDPRLGVLNPEVQFQGMEVDNILLGNTDSPVNEVLNMDEVLQDLNIATENLQVRNIEQLAGKFLSFFLFLDN